MLVFLGAKNKGFLADPEHVEPEKKKNDNMSIATSLKPAKGKKKNRGFFPGTMDSTRGEKLSRGKNTGSMRG